MSWCGARAGAGDREVVRGAPRRDVQVHLDRELLPDLVDRQIDQEGRYIEIEISRSILILLRSQPDGGYFENVTRSL